MRSTVQDPGIRLLRFGIAGLLLVHGIYRVATGGVSGFGEFLAAQGLPAGAAVAWAITLFEIFGTPFLAFGLGVVPLAALFSLELLAGILLVHRHAGWFVVGGGRNGIEYSVCLILGLTACALSELGARRPGSGGA